MLCYFAAPVNILGKNSLVHLSTSQVRSFRQYAFMAYTIGSRSAATFTASRTYRHLPTIHVKTSKYHLTSGIRKISRYMTKQDI